MFIGRERELKILEERYRSSKAELFVLYGRRRVGKTELLKEFSKDKRAVYYTASQVEPQDNLAGFKVAAQEVYADPVINDIGSIIGVLRHLINSSNGERLLIIVDEFPHWAGEDKSLPSLLQNFWDEIGKDSNLMVILCGSSVSLMIDQVLAEKSPLYGRRTGQYMLEPFDYRTSCRFFPNYEKREQLVAYGVLGGIPAYLAQFDPSVSLQENIVQQILTRGTFLNEETTFLLKTELRETRIYNSLLRTIAAGNTQLKDITSKMQKDRVGIFSYLSTLIELQLVKRVVSFDESAPEKSRKGRYVIEDNFFNFWYRFAAERLFMIEMDRGDQLYEQFILPQLSTYMGFVFESICQQYVARYSEEVGLPIPVKPVGKIWRKDFDIDVVTEGINGSWIVGECKWPPEQLGPWVGMALEDKAKQVVPTGIPIIPILFAAGDIDRKILEQCTCQFIGLSELLPD